MAKNSILGLTDRAGDTARSALSSAAQQQRAVEQQNSAMRDQQRGQQVGAVAGAGVMLAMGNPIGAAISLVGLL